MKGNSKGLMWDEKIRRNFTTKGTKGGNTKGKKR